MTSLYKVVTFVLITTTHVKSDSSDPPNSTMYTVLHRITNNYHKELPPKYDLPEDKQVEIFINLYIQSMYAFNDVDMDYSLTMFLRERWLDERLTFKETQSYPRLELEGSMVDKLWVPDVYILNEKKSIYHDVTVPNKMVHLYPNGTVQFSAKVTGTFSCLMYLKKYPFDTQICHLEMESYGHSIETLKFRWSEEAVTMAAGIKFPHFWLTNITIYECEKTYYSDTRRFKPQVSAPILNILVHTFVYLASICICLNIYRLLMYPCIGVKFIMQRNYEFHILHVYLPSILIVLLSWLNFWLDCTAVPARITLGLLTVLTMTTQSSSSMYNLSHVSYLKAIDIYMAVCLSFVFLGLVEFAYVNVLTRAERKEPEKLQCGVKIADVALKTVTNKSKPKSHNMVTWTELMCFRNLSNLGRAHLVDKISRILFPFTFGLFNLFYWCYYAIF